MSNYASALDALHQMERQMVPDLDGTAAVYATLALVDQQRAANLLWLARMGSGPISDAYVGEARKLIGPVLAGDQ